MTEEDKLGVNGNHIALLFPLLGVLQAYSNRKANDDAESWAEEAGSTATSKKYKSNDCSVGSACEQPPGATPATLCDHQVPCHFECQDLPCKDGCGADLEGMLV